MDLFEYMRENFSEDDSPLASPRRAIKYKRTYLIRFYRPVQKLVLAYSLLPFVEDGTVVLIGATTENPYFEVNGALISRSQAVGALSCLNSALVVLAMTMASVVLPVPGGP